MIKLLKKIFNEEKKEKEFEISQIKPNEVVYKPITEEERIEAHKIKSDPFGSPIFGKDKEKDKTKAFITKVDDNYKRRTDSLVKEKGVPDSEKYKGFVMGDAEFYKAQLKENRDNARREVEMKPVKTDTISNLQVNEENSSIKETDFVLNNSHFSGEDEFPEGYFDSIDNHTENVNFDEIDDYNSYNSYNNYRSRNINSNYQEEIHNDDFANKPVHSSDIREVDRKVFSENDYNPINEEVLEDDTNYLNNISSTNLNDLNEDGYSDEDEFDDFTDSSSFATESIEETVNNTIDKVQEMNDGKRTEPVRKKTVEFKLPPYEFLKTIDTSETDDTSYLQEMEMTINQTLEEFGINGVVTAYTNGPSITQFEIKLAPGVKVNKVTSIEDNIRMNLATSVRIEAPIPGKTTIGIEVPNKIRRMVNFANILSPEFIKNSNPLEISLGIDINGEVVTCDIAKMPHGLVAGSTGSGKSVCIDTILMSLLMKNTPEDLKIILIDPKVVGLANYKDIPHLITPIIKEPKLASQAMQWSVDEMERRYQSLYDLNVKDIIGYNRKVQTNPEYSHLQKMPYIVIVIEEMADLMAVVSSEVEEAVMRITQKARACGIHLLIATQRPSVDVIKGTIKSNIPTRIAMKVAGTTDSMTILDTGGAEKLLGNGDMILNFNGMGNKRLQGAYVTDEEIETVCDYLRTYEPEFFFTLESLLQQTEVAQKTDNLDPYFIDVAEFVIESNYASVNGVQKQFGIGFNRASAIFAELESQGVISPKNSKNPRKVQMTLDEFRGRYE